MRLIKASFAAMAIAAFASSCNPKSQPQSRGDAFKSLAGYYDVMPVPNAPVVEPKAKLAITAEKPEEAKPKEAKPPEFAKPAKLVPQEKIGKEYAFVRKFENSGFSVFKSNTGWILINDEEGKEYDKGKILSESGKGEPFRIVYRCAHGDIWYIDDKGRPGLEFSDPGGSLTPRPNY